jgi:hypothetical protein
MSSNSQRRFYSLRWVFLLLELLCLYFLFNCLFMLPGPYAGTRGVLIVISAVLAILFGFTSAKLFDIDGKPDQANRYFLAPPVVISLFSISVAIVLIGIGYLLTR